MSDVQEDVTLLATITAQDDASGVVEELQAQFDSLGGSLGSIGSAATSAGDEATDALGGASPFHDAMDTLGNTFTGIQVALETMAGAAGVAGVALAAAFHDATNGAVDYAQQLTTVQFLTGLTTEASAGLMAGFEGSGMSAQGAVTMITRLQAQLGALSMAQATNGKISAAQKHEMDLLGISFIDAHGNMRPLNVMMPSIIDHLKNMTNVTERDALARKLFGRSFADISVLVKAGGAAFIEASKDAERYGNALSQGQVDALNAFKSAQQTTKEAIEGFTGALAERALPALMKFEELIKRVAAWWHDLSPAIKDTILSFMSGIAIFGSLIGGATALSGILGQILPKLGPIGGMIGAISGPILAVASALGVAVAIFLALKYAYDHVTEAHKILQPVVDALLRVFDTLKVTGGLLWKTIQDIASSMGGNLKGNIIDVSKALAGDLTKALNTINGFLKDLNGAIELGVASWKKWHDPITTAEVVLARMGVPLKDVQAVFKVLRPILEEVGNDIKFVADAVGAGLSYFKTYGDLAGAIRMTLAQLGVPMSTINALFKIASDIWGVLVNAAKELYYAALPALQEAFVQLQPVFKQLQDALIKLAPLFGFIGMVIAVLVGGVFVGLVHMLSVLIPTAIRLVVDAIKVVVDIISMFANAFDHVVKIVNALIHGDFKTAFKELVGLTKDLHDGMLKLIGDLVGGISRLLGGLIIAAGAFVVGFVQGIIGSFQWLYDKLVGHSLIPDLVMGILNWIAWLGAGLWKAITTWKGLTEVIEWIVITAITIFRKLALQVMGVINALWAQAIGAFAGLGASVISTLEGLVGGAVNAARKLGGAIVSGIGSGLSGMSYLLKHALKVMLQGIPFGGGQAAIMALGLSGYATGGVVGPGYGGAHMGVVGEGREVEVIATLSQAIRAGMIASGGSHGEQVHITNFYMDGKLIQRQISKGMGASMRLQGASLGSNA